MVTGPIDRSMKTAAQNKVMEVAAMAPGSETAQQLRVSAIFPEKTGLELVGDSGQVEPANRLNFDS